MPTTTITQTPPEPTADDLRGLITHLETAWVARVTVRRHSTDDIGWRQIYVSLDDERIAVLSAGQDITRESTPGRHRVRVHNTLFWRTLDFNLAVGEHAIFSAVNRAGLGTYSIFAFFLGTNPIYLSLTRDRMNTAADPAALRGVRL